MELLTSQEIHKLSDEGYEIKFTGKKHVVFEGSKYIEQYYQVEVYDP